MGKNILYISTILFLSIFIFTYFFSQKDNKDSAIKNENNIAELNKAVKQSDLKKIIKKKNNPGKINKSKIKKSEFAARSGLSAQEYSKKSKEMYAKGECEKGLKYLRYSLSKSGDNTSAFNKIYNYRKSCLENKIKLQKKIIDSKN